MSEVNLANYERIRGDDELGVYEYRGEYQSAPGYVLADAYGNQFPFETKEAAEMAQMLADIAEATDG